MYRIKKEQTTTIQTVSANTDANKINNIEGSSNPIRYANASRM